MASGFAADPEPNDARSRRLARVAVPLVAVGSCVLAVLAFGVGARDDDYITYWVAEQLAKTGNLVNINGAHIEQSSSLAHVVLLAALFFVTRAPLPVLGLLVGLASLAATIVLSARLARQIRPGAELPTAVVVALAFPVTFWATGRLETLFAAAAVLWFLLRLHLLLSAPTTRARSLCAFVASAVLVVTVRPDTMVVSAGVVVLCACVAAVRRLSHGRSDRWLPPIDLRGALIAAAGVLGSAAVLAAFRLVVFHSVLPQPEIAKSGGIGWFSWGFSYVFTSFPWWMWATFSLLSVLGVVWCLRCRSLPGLLSAATFIGGTASIMFTRGDWMGGARLLVPYLVPGLIVMVVGAWSLRLVARRVALVGLLAVECVTLVLFAQGTIWLSSSFSGVAPSATAVLPADLGSPFGAVVTSSGGAVPAMPWYTSWDYSNTRDAVFLAAATPVLRQIVDAHTGPGKITIASYQAGMIAYTWQNEFPGRLRFIDTDNVVTNDFSRCSDLYPSFSGQIVAFDQWVADAGSCAPPLPDLVYFLDAPSDWPQLTTYYHAVAAINLTYVRRSFGVSVPLVGGEFLAERNGWNP